MSPSRAPRAFADQRPPAVAGGAAPAGRRSLTRTLAGAVAALACAFALLACGTGHPSAIASQELAEAQTFPFFKVYWVGPSFEGHHLTAADGRRNYLEKVGDSVYYGDCVKSKGIFGGGSCVLPLQVTTVIYHLHSNGPLGPQHNTLIRGVPATIYDEGHSIEVYTGRVAIDVFSDSFANAYAAAERLQPINAPAGRSGRLPLPVFCPGLAGPVTGLVAKVMSSLPHRACQHDAAEEAFAERLST